MRWTPRRSCSWTRSAGSPCCRRTGTAPSSLGTCSPSGHVPGTGFGNSFLVFSNLVGRLFRRLVLTDSTGTSLLRQSSSHIFGRFTRASSLSIALWLSSTGLLISSSGFFSDYYQYRRRDLLNSFKSFHNQGMNLRRFTLIVEIRPSLLHRFNYQLV